MAIHNAYSTGGAKRQAPMHNDMRLLSASSICLAKTCYSRTTNLVSSLTHTHEENKSTCFLLDSAKPCGNTNSNFVLLGKSDGQLHSCSFRAPSFLERAMPARHTMRQAVGGLHDMSSEGSTLTSCGLKALEVLSAARQLLQSQAGPGQLAKASGQ